MKKIIKYLTHPREALICLMNKNFFFFLPDKLYLKWKYKLLIGKKLDLKNPKLLSEKLQWLKLYNRNPEYTEMVDKYEVRNYIENKIGKQYLIPLVGVYDNFDDIDFDKLPNQFVIKCTHDSGGLVICKDKNTLNMKAAKKKINKFMKRNYYKVHREWPYKNVKPRIVIEKYIENKIVNSNMNIESDVLKVGHHGSSTSTSSIFLKKVNPKMAIISVGKNNEFNHPDKKVIHRLNENNVKIYQTSIDGNIVLTSNGTKITKIK